MSKRLIVKLAVMVAALSAMTLLQGCYEEEDRFVTMTAWLPVGSVLPFEGLSQGAAVGAGQGAAGGVASQAVGAGGGNQVSVGLAQ